MTTRTQVSFRLLRLDAARSRFLTGNTDPDATKELASGAYPGRISRRAFQGGRVGRCEMKQIRADSAQRTIYNALW
jgi:hypothetical protein